MPVQNRLLAALTRRQRASMEPLAKLMPLSAKMVLYEPGETIKYVYFPISGVISMVNEPRPGQIVEFATIGHEGMTGVPLLLDAKAMPSRVLVQVPGEGWRLPAQAFRQLLQRNPGFRSLLLRYTLALLSQIAQSASCNRIHEIHERCARWLLQTHDRVDNDKFELTQEFLAQMLGVQRSSVNVAAALLERKEIISYARGVITINDRKRLEAASCECYDIITAEYDHLLGKKWRL